MNKIESGIESVPVYSFEGMARPQIPVEVPEKRDVRVAPSPVELPVIPVTPTTTPTPVEIPGEPVPITR